MATEKNYLTTPAHRQAVRRYENKIYKGDNEEKRRETNRKRSLSSCLTTIKHDATFEELLALQTVIERVLHTTDLKELTREERKERFKDLTLRTQKNSQ